MRIAYGITGNPEEPMLEGIQFVDSTEKTTDFADYTDLYSTEIRVNSCNSWLFSVNSFVTNEEGKITAVLLDLERYGDIWEDIYDILLTQERADEPRESLAEVEEKLTATGSL